MFAKEVEDESPLEYVVSSFAGTLSAPGAERHPLPLLGLILRGLSVGNRGHNVALAGM